MKLPWQAGDIPELTKARLPAIIYGNSNDDDGLLLELRSPITTRACICPSEYVLDQLTILFPVCPRFL